MGRGIDKKYLEAFKENFGYDPEEDNEPDPELAPLFRKKKKKKKRRRRWYRS